MDPFIQLPAAELVNGRFDSILSACASRRVLHVGCVDAGFLEERFAHGDLLHQRLAGVAGELWGVDADEAGISFLRDRGFNNLIVGDVCRRDWLGAVSGQDFDVIVASEVVEHLMNPGLFLEGVQELMVDDTTKLLITVPNAFRLDTLRHLLSGIEFVHPDHNYWFSYHTLTNLLKKSGLQIDTVLAYSFRPTRLTPGMGPVSKALAADRAKVDTSPTAPLAEGRSRQLVQGVGHYARSLPGRLVTRYLYGRTPFWADGLIVFATRPHRMS